MVINIGALKSGQNELVESDIKAVVDASGKFKPVNLPNLQEQTS